MSSATRDSWKTLPPPAKKKTLGFSALYTDADAEKMMRGLVPEAMEDKWFVYFFEDWLYFHRSWTGACIYAVRLESSSASVRVVDSWVSGDPQQYRADDLAYDRKLVAFLIDALLLGKPAEFPRAADTPQETSAIYQYHIVGRSYPEAAHHPTAVF